MLYDHALYSICIFTMFHAFRCVFICWKLCIDRFGLGWTHDRIFFLHITCSCIFFMHTYPFFSIFWYYFFMVLFCLSPSLLNSLRMTPNRKSASSWNTLHSETSSFDPTPLQPWYSFGMPRGSIRFFRYCFTHCHSQSGMGISMWDTREMSHCDHSGVLLQHARFRYLYTSVCYVGSRYTYCSHSRYYFRNTTCFAGVAS